MTGFIKFKNVFYKTDNNKSILKNINLEIKKGEFISIIGSNGCGKSTFLKHFNGILTPTTGNIFIDGLNTNLDDNLKKIRKKLGIVFQNPDIQIIASTVEEEIAFGLENICVPQKEMNLLIKESLHIVGLDGFEKKSVHTLSGGQKQRLNIASVIAMKPEIILFDEPTSMLDPFGRENIMKLILILNKIHKCTILLITHLMDEVILSDRVITFQNGEIISDENTENISYWEKYIDIISPIQSLEILNFIKSLGYNVKTKNLKSIDCANQIIKLLEHNKND